MEDNVLTLYQSGIRGADTNSLLRMYDTAGRISTKSPSLGERDKARRAIERIARELQRRKVQP